MENKKVFVGIAFILGFLFNSLAMAQTNRAGALNSGSTNTRPSGALDSTPTDYTKKDQANGIHDTAVQNGKNLDDSSQTNSLMGIGLFASCGACFVSCEGTCAPVCSPMCMMGGMAMAQSGADSGAADGNWDIANKTALDSSGKAAALRKNGLTQDQKDQMSNNMDELKKLGYSVDGKGNSTGPDGKSYPAGTFSSAESMAKAGFSAEAIAKANDALEKAKNAAKAKVVAMGTESAGGGYSYGKGIGKTDGKKGGFDPFKLLQQSKQGGARGPASVGSLTKEFNGEPIGVKIDNIFDMVHRRYQVKRQANQFNE